ncbi:acyl-CoA dehydrogenase family protein [Streptomyces sp. ISL-11]|uniref:acyl-CoA dehydrogenase family protein n=1 Tax=Streptomyces sp. ISL-11 TaxID=2819174 RepID=UPI001BE7ED3C|nr:acyl-CoA dehydrogenase [Streptomyces sp. ISL-11]MBT2383356.1 acyl-CoA dehydrogenase [Streptomyces sp. ISL-11]
MPDTPLLLDPAAADVDGLLADALAALPDDADARRTAAALGAAGALARLYAGLPAGRLHPVPLRKLLAAAEARGRQGTVLALCVQLASALPLLAEGAARSAPAARTLSAVTAGEELLALAATDESAGSDLTALTTEVDLGEDTLTLRGTKRWVTSALTAGHALVLARHREGRHFTSFTWVLVPLSAPGVTVRAVETELFEGAGLGHIELAGVTLPRDHLVGRPGMGLALFARHIATERLASAAWAIALCRRVLADTERRLAGRTVDGEPLSRSPLVRHRLAGCAVEVSALHALWTQLHERIATDRDGTAAALLKAASGTTVEHVLAVCGQLQGADGFGTDGVQRLRAESQVFGIGGGTTEVVLGTVADRLDAVLDELAP